MSSPSVRLTVPVLATLLATVPLAAQDPQLLRRCYQVDRDRDGELAPECVAIDPGRWQPEPCFAGAGVGNATPRDFVYQDLAFDVDTRLLDDGFHSLTVWFEAAAPADWCPPPGGGGFTGPVETATTVHWFFVTKPPADAARMEVAFAPPEDPLPSRCPRDPPQTEPEWSEVDAWSEDIAGCPDAPLRLFDLDTSGLAPGHHALLVRLLGPDGRVGSQRCAVFEVCDPVAVDPPSLRGDLPGEVCGDNRDNDGDRLIDLNDPECGGPSLGPELALVPAERCPGGEAVFTTAVPVDRRAFTRGGIAYAVLPGVPPDRLDLERHALEVSLRVEPPANAVCQYDRCSRLATVSWSLPSGPFDAIDCRFDRANAPACSRFGPAEPTPPGRRLLGDATSCTTEMAEEGQFAAGVVGRFLCGEQHVAYWSLLCPLDVPFFCLRDLRAECRLNGPSPRVELSWQRDCGLRGSVEVHRGVDGGVLTLLDTLSADQTSYSDSDVERFGSYVYQVKAVGSECHATNSAAASVDCEVPRFRRGDAGGNTALEVSDAIRILGYLFLGTDGLSCLNSADSDDNGAVELTDAVRILGYLFLGAPPPPPPGPLNCGQDPTPGERLGCERYDGC